MDEQEADPRDSYYSDDIEVEYMDGHNPNSPIFMETDEEEDVPGYAESRRLAALDAAVAIGIAQINDATVKVSGAGFVLAMATDFENWLKGGVSVRKEEDPASTKCSGWYDYTCSRCRTESEL